MRIGIDARAASEEAGGRGRYVRELLRALAARDDPHEYVLYARAPWPELSLDGRFRWSQSNLPDPFWHLAVAARARHCDVLLSTNSYLTAWAGTVPTVITMHDLVAFDTELAPRRRSMVIERATLPLAVRRAAGFVAVSASTRSDLERLFPAARGRSSLTPLAADAGFRPDGSDDPDVWERHAISRPYLLAVGTLEPRKNLPRLVRAFAALPDKVRGDHQLLLVGGTGWDTAETLETLERHRGLVRRLQSLEDVDLAALYRGATVFCCPSIYEGFGLPVLEAMASGVAVLTSNRSSLPEVAGDAAVLVDPLDEGSIGAGIARLLGDAELRGRLSRAGVVRAAEFSWDRTAQRTLEALDRAASARS